MRVGLAALVLVPDAVPVDLTPRFRAQQRYTETRKQLQVEAAALQKRAQVQRGPASGMEC